MRKWRGLALLASISFSVLALLGCPTDLPDQSIKIGVVAVQSGNLASYGIPSARAAQMAANNVNASGGAGGYAIELVIRDDACEVNAAASVAAGVVSDGVVAVLGHTCSGSTSSALPIYDAAEILVISPSATNVGLSSYQYFFRTIPTDMTEASALVDYASDTLGASSVAIVSDGEAYGTQLAGFVEDVLAEDPAGTTAALNLDLVSGKSNYDTEVSSVVAASPGAIIFCGYADTAATFFNDLRSAGSTIPVIGASALEDDALVAAVGNDPVSLYVAAPKPAVDSTLWESLNPEYVALYGEEPGPFFLNAYAAALCLFAAIDESGSTSAAVLASWLKANSVNTPLGQISFDQDGEVIGDNVGFSIYVLAGGEFAEPIT